jgi:hypothetical protein
MTVSFHPTRAVGSVAVNATPAASAGHANEVVRRVAGASNGTAGVSTMPAFISAEEEYFWSVPWQEDIRESLAERKAGESRVFNSDDPNDVVRWLLSHDDS